MAKKKKAPAAPARTPFSFTWNGKEYREYDRLIVCLPVVGMQEEVTLLPCSYHYSFGYWSMLSFSSVSWCNFVITVKHDKGEADMKWWQWELVQDGENAMKWGKFRDSPYHQAGCPKEIRTIPMQFDDHVIRPVGEWEFVPPQPVVLPPPIVEYKPIIEQLTLF